MNTPITFFGVSPILVIGVYFYIKWKINIKNSFIRINGKRLSNGPMEGINSRIKTMMKSANGFRNFNRFRNRVIYSINKNVPIKGTPKK